MNQALKRVAPIGEERDREILKDAATYVYAERADGPVQAHVYFPPGDKADKAPRPVIIFFHGGFWDTPTPTQFVPHCLHFASRGAVTITAETRSQSVNQTGAIEAIEDSRDLIRWVRENAADLNINPESVVIGGAAGGALLALMTTMPKDKALEANGGTNCRAQALLLFSALVGPLLVPKALDRFSSPKQARSHSPLHKVRRKLPPMIAFHGKADRITPFVHIDKFRRKLSFWGNRFELIDFERADHSFFNFNVSHDRFEATIGAADRFLVDLGIIDEDAEFAVD